MCPYYLAREMQAEADIVFMPYNYILDIKVQYMYVCIHGSAENFSSHSPINGGKKPFADYRSNFEILYIPVVDTPHC